MSKVEYTDGDYENIGTIKKAADVVYDYVRWVLEDHNRTLIEKEHQKVIVKLTEDVATIMGIQSNRTQLALYFIANVVQAARDCEESRSNIRGWTVFNDDMLKDLYLADQVAFLMGNYTAQMSCAFAGLFMAEQTVSHVKREAVQLGELVGADPVFVMTSDWRALLEQADVEDDDYISVGKALEIAMPMNNTAESLAQMLAGLNTEL